MQMGYLMVSERVERTKDEAERKNKQEQENTQQEPQREIKPNGEWRRKEKKVIVEAEAIWITIEKIEMTIKQRKAKAKKLYVRLEMYLGRLVNAKVK